MRGKSLAVAVSGVVGAAVLFSLAHPGILAADGITMCGWFVYVPLFLLVRRFGCKCSAVLGACYGLLAYALFGFWLFRYSFISLLAVCAVYALFHALLFLLLRCCFQFVPRFAWFLQPLLVLCFEFLRTLGDIGFHYGILGYSQWRVPWLVRCAAFSGVWGITALMLLFSSVCAQSLCDFLAGSGDTGRRIRHIIRKRWRELVIVAVAIAGFAGYGALAPLLSAAGDGRTLSVALIQNNDDPWKNTIAAARRSCHAHAAYRPSACRTW